MGLIKIIVQSNNKYECREEELLDQFITEEIVKDNGIDKKYINIHYEEFCNRIQADKRSDNYNLKDMETDILVVKLFYFIEWAKYFMEANKNDDEKDVAKEKEDVVMSKWYGHLLNIIIAEKQESRLYPEIENATKLMTLLDKVSKVIKLGEQKNILNNEAYFNVYKQFVFNNTEENNEKVSIRQAYIADFEWMAQIAQIEDRTKKRDTRYIDELR